MAQNKLGLLAGICQACNQNLQEGRMAAPVENIIAEQHLLCSATLQNRAESTQKNDVKGSASMLPTTQARVQHYVGRSTTTATAEADRSLLVKLRCTCTTC
jgi:hypothetical protein